MCLLFVNNGLRLMPFHHYMIFSKTKVMFYIKKGQEKGKLFKISFTEHSTIILT